jgi:hypothetical protein
VAHIQNGRVTQAQRTNTVIRRPGGGPRTVVAQRPGNRLVVVHGGGRGYVQRPVMVGRRAYVQRTNYVNGTAYVTAYRAVSYNGVALNFYAPMRYYPLALYGWALDPWLDLVDYSWGWGGDPWFVYYGPYFRPWGRYARGSLWLTDFLIGRTLQAAFLAREEARAAGAVAAAAEPAEAAAPMSDEVKEKIEAEVRSELAESQAEAGQSQGPSEALPPSFNDKGAHLFLASNNLEAQNTASGETCVIGEGDAIEMNGGLPRRGSNVSVLVRASKGSNCPVNSAVSIPLTDLVEMRNNMRETVEQGLEALRAGQGAGNLPRLPVEAAGEPTLTAFAASMQPDADVVQALEEAASQADQIEQEVMADYGSPPPGGMPAPAPASPAVDNQAGLLASIQTGQTESQVIAILGQPLKASFLGGLKKQYEYGAGKVTFTNGEVSDVELSAAGAAAAPPQAAPAPPRSRLGGVPGAVSRAVQAGIGGVLPSRNKSGAAPNPEQAPAVAPPSGTAGSQVTIGQTESEVVAALGEPLRVSFLGGLKKMYEYRDCKIIFTDGSVSEVQ